jgi:hypothetical protein
MKKIFFSTYSFILFFTAICLYSCTKYTANTKSSSTTSGSSGSGGSGATPLGGGGAGTGGSGTGGSGTGGSGSGGSGSGGSGSGGSGSGGSGSGGSGSGGSGSGGSVDSSTLFKTYIQGLNYTSNLVNATLFCDSIALLKDGLYTVINKATANYGVAWGNHESATLGSFTTLANMNYSFVVFDGVGVPMKGIMLNNGIETPADKRAYIRFINIDPVTSNVPATFSFESYVDTVKYTNRKYLDHITDTSLSSYKNIYATTGYITIKMNNIVVTRFQNAFEQGKKYTIFAMSNPVSGNSKVYIARHNW